MNGITSCSARRVCVRHTDAVTGNDTEAKLHDLHGVRVISVPYSIQTITLSQSKWLSAPVFPCCSLLVFICFPLLTQLFISRVPSTVFVLVALYFPAGDHCRGSGLHYLPRGESTFCLNVFASCFSQTQL